MISKLRPTVGRFLSEFPAIAFFKIGMTPNALTLLGLAFSIFTGWVIAEGYLFLGGLLVLFTGWFDMLDGALARITGKQSRFGALLDSSVDRISEAAIFLGLLVFFADTNDTLEVVLCYVAIISSIMVSYARARAESLDFKGEVGILARPERMVLLTLGLLLSELSLVVLVVALGIIAAGASLTAAWRLIYAFRQSNDETSNSPK